jgi:hypothetical protein
MVSQNYQKGLQPSYQHGVNMVLAWPVVYGDHSPWLAYQTWDKDSSWLASWA